MQKLGSLTTPMGTAQACGPVAGRLNSSERVGTVLSGVKTLPNSSDEHFTREQEEHQLLVFVLNKHETPLMPCKPAKARHLLRDRKAKVVRRTPFTIQLLYGSSGYRQEITLGIDAGYSEIGYNAVTETKELIAGKLELRNDIKRLLEKRRNYRRTRRSRKWYREPRFNNRKRGDGWLAPSLEHKLQDHISLVERIKRMLPISKVVVEVASFDTQKMQNLEIKGIEYQQGELEGYEVREYLLEKWKRKCAYCKKSNLPLQVEHTVPKSRGGSDRIHNLTLACQECNLKKGNQTAKEFGYPRIQKQASVSLKATAFMNNVRWKLVNLLECEWTYGYITKYNRTKLNLAKSHVNDAFVIAGGTNQIRVGSMYIGKCVRRQNRSLFKANFLKGHRLKRNTVREVNGFRRFDKVKFGKVECFIYGLRKRGFFDLRGIDGTKISASVGNKKLKLLERANGKIEEVESQFLTATRLWCPLAT